MKTVQELAREAGFEVHERKKQVRVGIDALVGIDSTEKLSRFRDLVLRDAEKAVYAVKPVETDMMLHEQFAFETAILLAGDAIRAMKGQK